MLSFVIVTAGWTELPSQRNRPGMCSCDTMLSCPPPPHWSHSTEPEGCALLHTEPLNMVIKCPQYQRPYFVHAEQSLVLGNHSVARLSQNSDQRFLIQAVQRNDHRQTANKLWDHSKLDQVPGLHVLQQPVLLLYLCHRVRLTAGVGQVCGGRSTPTFPQVGWSSETQVLRSDVTSGPS